MGSFKTLLLALVIGCVLLASGARAEGLVPYADTATFQEKILNVSPPVLLQFDAKWCPYCRKMQPVIENFFKTSQGKLLVFKLDVDHDGAIADRYDIRTLPTLILFSQGKEIARHEGTMDEEALKEWVAAALSD
jgi:thioredoxin